MFVKIPITYKTLTEKFKITKRSDGRYCCRIPISYETTADGKKIKTSAREARTLKKNSK